MEKSREKAMKRATWFRGKDDEEKAWKPLPKSRSQGRISKRKKNVFLKAGKGLKSKTDNSTVVFVPSTRGGILLSSLKEEEDKMAEMTGFRIKYQEAGVSILANAFNKNLGIGQPCGRKDCPPCTESGGKVNCKARCSVYESKCLTYNPESSLEEDPVGTQPSGRVSSSGGVSSQPRGICWRELRLAPRTCI